MQKISLKGFEMIIIYIILQGSTKEHHISKNASLHEENNMQFYKKQFKIYIKWHCIDFVKRILSRLWIRDISVFQMKNMPSNGK